MIGFVAPLTAPDLTSLVVASSASPEVSRKKSSLRLGTPAAEAVQCSGHFCSSHSMSSCRVPDTVAPCRRPLMRMTFVPGGGVGWDGGAGAQSTYGSTSHG